MRQRLDAERVAARLGDFLDAAPDAMVVVGPEGRILAANNHTLTLFGYVADELIGRSIEILVPERFRAPHVLHRDRYEANPHTRPMHAGLDLSGLRKDHSEFPVEISLSPVDTADGRLTIAAIRDSSERRDNEAKFRGAWTASS